MLSDRCLEVTFMKPPFPIWNWHLIISSAKTLSKLAHSTNMKDTALKDVLQGIFLTAAYGHRQT